MKQTVLAFRSWFVLILLPSFAVALMLLLFIYSLNLFGSEEWWKGLESPIKYEKVAPVSSLKGCFVTFPAAEVCVNHSVVCCEATMDLYPFVNVVLRWKEKLEIICIPSANWNWRVKVWLMLQSGLKDMIGTSKTKNASATSSRWKPHRGNLWMITAWFHEWYVCFIVFCLKPFVFAASHFPPECQTIIPKVAIFVLIFTPNVSWTFIHHHGALSQEG